MWIPFSYENEVYMLKIKETENALKIQLTDLTHLYLNNFSKEEIYEEFQLLNPTFDIKVDEALKKVLDMLQKIEETEFVITKLDTALQLNLTFNFTSHDCKFKVKYNVNLKKDDTNSITEEFTLPMMRTVKYLEEQQKKLCVLLEKKDRELEEYKLEKGDISREDLITEKFEKNILLHDDERLMLNVFSKSQSFLDCFKDQHGDVETKLAEVKANPWNVVKKRKIVYSAKTSKKACKGITYNS